MAKWKLFGKSKSKKEKQIEQDEFSYQKESKEPIEPVKTDQEPKESKETEYHETLYTKEHTPEEQITSPEKSEEPWRRERWENVNTVEKNIDKIDTKKRETKTQAHPSHVEKKVDALISKRKK